MPRARTGTLVPPGADGFWRAKVTTERGRELFSLGTTDKAVARRELAKLVARVANGDDLSDLASSAGASERVRDYVEGWLAAREARGVAGVKAERSMLGRHVLDAIGALPLTDLLAIAEGVFAPSSALAALLTGWLGADAAAWTEPPTEPIPDWVDPNAEAPPVATVPTGPPAELVP